MTKPVLRLGQLAVLAGLTLAACSSDPSPTASRPTTTAPDLPEPTASSQPSPTPLPGPFGVWIAPALPPALRTLTLQAVEAAPERFYRVDAAELAQLRVEPRAERTLAHWIYVAAAPFPTLEDAISMEQLRALWEGREQQPPVLLSPSTLEALRPQMGLPAGAALRRTEEPKMLEAAWGLADSRALLPFEDLQPRWKVLQVEGQNPLHLDLDTRLYPLIVPFGLSGEAEAAAELEAILDWPASNREREHMTVLLMTGVSALVRTTAWQMEQRGPLFPAQDVGGWMREADLTHISNEVSFAAACPFPDPYTSNLRFCSRPAHIALFEEAGVDLVELTGNHLLDWGEPAFQYTLGLYAERGWQTFGGGANLETAVLPALVEHNGNRLAFLGCNAAGPAEDWATPLTGGAAPCADPRLLQQVAELRAQGYLPIFTYQWAESLSPRPLPDQVQAFRRAAEVGAVIVSGSQAHRPQALEFYAGGFIHYGLGNLFFDQMHTFAYRQEFLDRHVFYQGRHISTELLTAMLEDYARPRPMLPEERRELLVEIFTASGW